MMNRIWKQRDDLVKENQRLEDRIKRLEEELMDVKNKHAALVADVALYEDRGERIKRLEDIISRASRRFFRNGSNGMVASGMLAILEEMRKP
jgi:cell division septum initiation protein DivIVA